MSIENVVLPDGQIIVKKVTPDLFMLDSVIVHHHDNMYQDENQKARVEWVTKKATSNKVIEVGTATGYVISKVQANFKVGVDNNIARLLLASMRYPDITFYYANIFNLTPFYKEGFDCLIATEIIEHLPYDQVRYALYHCLNTAPKMVVTIPFGKNVMNNSEHLWSPTVESFSKILSDAGIPSNIVEVEYVGDFIMMVIQRT